MDYRDKVFIAVAENLSFSKAASELYISQPAVTKHIKELESQLGIAMFERKGNKVYLTRAGEITYTHLKKVAQLYSELEFSLGTFKDEYKGTLRIGASSTISQYVIPAVLAAFHKRYPKIELNLLNGNSFEMEKKLVNSEIDLAMVENYSSHSNLKYFNFAEDEIITITGQNSTLAKTNSIDLTDFQRIPIVLRERGSGTLEVIEKEFIRAGINIEHLNILLHLGSTEAIKNFLQNFDGIALVSEKAIEKELQLKTLRKIDVKNLSIKRNFRIVLPHGPELKLPQAFINFLLNYNLKL
jgi:LysR family transcriptional regulator, transcriptional activator of the cysJI operon